MISDVLVAVDDSPGGLAAAQLAVDLSAALKTHLHALAVTADGHVAQVFATSNAADSTLPVASADAVLRHVDALARRAGVPIESHRAEGEVATAVLAATESCHAGLVVMGRTRDPRDGRGVIGSQTSLVLEFTAVPVVVVPPS